MIYLVIFIHGRLLVFIESLASLENVSVGVEFTLQYFNSLQKKCRHLVLLSSQDDDKPFSSPGSSLSSPRLPAPPVWRSPVAGKPRSLRAAL